MSNNPTATSQMAVPERLSIAELLAVVREANVLKIMAEKRTRRVIVDYAPARAAMAIPRDDDTQAVEAYPIATTTLVFTLDDAMFGGVVFVALTCGERVIINPFSWVSYEHLGTVNFETRR